MVPRVVNLIDLLNTIPGVKGIIERNNKEEIDNLLFPLGFDIKQGWEVEQCLHRPLTAKNNEPVFGVRIVGYERSDPKWLRSEHCTWENKVENSEVELRDELISMSKQSNFTGDLLAHIEENFEE